MYTSEKVFTRCRTQCSTGDYSSATRSYYRCSLFDYPDPTVRLHYIIILLHVYVMLFLSDSGSCRYCCVVVGCARRWVDFIWSCPYWTCNLNGTKIWILCNGIPRSKLQYEFCAMGTITACYVYNTDFVLFFWFWIDPFMSIKLLLFLLLLLYPYMISSSACIS